MPSFVLFAAAISAALAMGQVPALLRSLQAPLEHRLLLREGRLDRLNLYLMLAWIPLMPLAGWFVDNWGTHEVLFVGSLLLGVAVAWLVLSQSLAHIAWGVLGLASGGACVATAGVALMPAALRLSPRWSTGAALCLGYVFVGAAALLTPVVVPWLTRQFGLYRTALTLALFGLVPALLVAVLNGEVAPEATLIRGGFLDDVRFWLVALVAFLYFPLENALHMWPRRYLADIGYSGRSIVRLLAGFWCAFLLLRFGLAWMIRPGAEAWLVLALVIISSVVLGNLAGAYAPSSGYFGFWLVGACYGPILPALLAILVDLEAPRGVPGQAIGAVFALSALSCLTVQPLFSAFVKNHSPRETMRIPMILGLVMAAPMLVLALIRLGR